MVSDELLHRITIGVGYEVQTKSQYRNKTHQKREPPIAKSLCVMIMMRGLPNIVRDFCALVIRTRYGLGASDYLWSDKLNRHY